jgi:hypothetical protein
MKTVGLLDSLYAGVGVIVKPIGAGVDVITDVGDAVSGAAKGTKNTVNTLAFLLPLILIIAVVFAVVYFGKKYKVTK